MWTRVFGPPHSRDLDSAWRTLLTPRRARGSLRLCPCHFTGAESSVLLSTLASLLLQLGPATIQQGFGKTPRSALGWSVKQGWQVVRRARDGGSKALWRCEGLSELRAAALEGYACMLVAYAMDRPSLSGIPRQSGKGAQRSRTNSAWRWGARRFLRDHPYSGA